MTATDALASRCIAGLLTAAGLMACATGALAGTIVVTHFDDIVDDNDGTCTLREAIRSANADANVDACVISGSVGQEEIVLSAGTYAVDLANGTGEDAGVDGDLDITGPLDLRGVAPDYTVIDGNAVTSQERVFDVGANIGVSIRDLTVTGGHEPAGDGGNIRSRAIVGMTGGLTLENVVVADGRAVRGGGVFVLGRMAARRVRLTGNEAVTADGAGGGIAFGGELLFVADSEISGNRAASGGGVYSSGVGPSIIQDSRVTGNVAVAGGGAQSGWGGGIASVSGSVDVSRTLIEGNEAEVSGGGLWLAVNNDELRHSAVIGNSAGADGGGVYGSADAFIRHSTLAGNEAASGGGIYTVAAQFLLDAVTLADNSGGGVWNESGAFFEASILADNAGGNCLGDAPGAGVYNLDDADTCGFPTGDPDLPSLVNTDPLLGPLQDNGAGLPTFALLEDSPAIDAVSSTVRTNCQNVADQRGYPRGWPPILASGQDPEFLCDIGAFERHPAYVVDTTADTVDELEEDGICADAAGACSLRAAITTANTVPGRDEIELAAGTYVITRTGADEDENETGDLDIDDFVDLRGQGAGETVIDAAQLDRALHFHALSISKAGRSSVLSTVSDLEIRAGAADGGGAILSAMPLRLERTALRSNSAATGNGGAVLCLDDCDLRISDSTLAGNAAEAGHGGAIFDVSGGVLQVERSTLSGNRATIGGAIEAGRGLRLLNTTFSGNTAGSSGAFFASQAVIESGTFFDNEATGDTGAFFLLQPSIIGNSIVAANRVGDDPDNCSFNPGGLVSAGFNLSDTAADDCNLTVSSDLVETDPLLDPLADNDGHTHTHGPGAGSPAIDAGSVDRCPAMDQRGLMRPADGDDDGTAICDIGAVELQPEPEPDPDPPDPPSGGGGGGDDGGGGGGATGWLLVLGLLSGFLASAPHGRHGLHAGERRTGGGATGVNPRQFGKSSVFTKRKVLWSALVLLVITGCGGGGGGSGEAPSPPPPGSDWDGMQWDDGRWG